MSLLSLTRSQVKVTQSLIPFALHQSQHKPTLHDLQFDLDRHTDTTERITTPHSRVVITSLFHEPLARPARFCLTVQRKGKIATGGVDVSHWHVIFFLRKIVKIVASKCWILTLKPTKIDFGWGSAPEPAGGAYSALLASNHQSCLGLSPCASRTDTLNHLCKRQHNTAPCLHSLPHPHRIAN